MAYSFLAVVFLAVTAHFAFSHLGFPLTDDGLVLSASRRILDGQIPHRDFIDIRPSFSAILHSPVVAFGGDHVLLISRFLVWLQLAIISVLWVSILTRLTEIRLNILEKSCLILISFAGTANTLLILAWYTIDAFFFSTVGIWLALQNRPAFKSMGYFFLGLAVLCKQSAVFIAPGLLLLTEDKKKPSCYVFFFAPLLLYGFYLALNGAISDAWFQTTAHSDLFIYGIRPYMRFRFTAGIVAGAAFFIAFRKSSWSVRTFAVLAIAAFLVYPLRDFNCEALSFALAGMIAGAGAVSGGKMRIAAALIFLTGWSLSLSIGINCPRYACGIMLVFLTLAALEPSSSVTARKFFRTLAALLALAVVPALYYGRTNYLYRESPASELKYALGEVLKGGQGIWTNARTYAFLADMRRAISEIKKSGRVYAVLPSATAYWIKADDKNPLPVDWAWSTEMGEGKLEPKVLAALDRLKGNGAVLVARCSPQSVRHACDALRSEEASVPEYVAKHFKKTGETEFFLIYS